MKENLIITNLRRSVSFIRLLNVCMKREERMCDRNLFIDELYKEATKTTS